MRILKGALFDILVTLAILAAVFFPVKGLEWFVVGYTPLLLILKIIDFAGGGVSGLMIKRKKDETPAWVYHVLYGLNVVVLMYSQWFITGGQWAVIWLLSWLTAQKMQKKKRPE